MSIKNTLKQYFIFTSRERNAIVVLLLIMAILILANSYVSYKVALKQSQMPQKVLPISHDSLVKNS